MNFYTLTSIILTIAVTIGYLNHRFIKMPPTIAIMSGALLLSLFLLGSNYFGLGSAIEPIKATLTHIDFHSLLMDGMLGFLLFAGGLSIHIHELRNRKWEIASLASMSTIVSAILIGYLLHFLLNLIGVSLPLSYCLLFGALISPTDPIAVLAMCKDMQAPRQLTITIAGESLFNDGVGIVLFASIYSAAFSNSAISISNISWLFLQQAIGGIAYGLFLGWIATYLIKTITDHKLAILITLAITTAGYTLGIALNLSGPLAMVVVGIYIGNQHHCFKLTESALAKLDNFWELIDEILNAMLFLILGLEILMMPLTKTELIAAAIAIPLVLTMRFITVAIPMSIFKQWRRYEPHTISILTWGGLRGGLAVALALSLPNGMERDLILGMTYVVVIFAIIVQGMTIKPLVKLSRKAST